MTSPTTASLPQPLSAASELARNLVAARGAVGVTQQALAQRSGISRATIAQIEAGASDARQSTIELLANALGITPVVLVLGVRDVEALLALKADRATNASGTPDAAHEIGAAIGRAIRPGRADAVAAFAAAASTQRAVDSRRC